MRGVLVLVLVTACGRIGFAPGDAGPPDSAGVAVPALCDPADLVDFTGGEVERLRATRIPTGYAVALATTAGGPVFMLRVAADASTAEVHQPFGAGYTLYGVAAIADQVFVTLGTDVAYLKHLDATWDSYATVEEADLVPADPPIAARSATTGMRARVAGGVLELAELDAGGLPTGLVDSYAPVATGVAVSAAAAVVRVALDAGGGACATFLDDAGAASAMLTLPGCRAPRVAALTGARAALAYTTADGTHLELVDGAARGEATDLPAAAGARLSAADGAPWALTRTGMTTALTTYDDGTWRTGRVPVTAIYDLAGDRVFWMDGATVRTGRACLL